MKKEVTLITLLIALSSLCTFSQTLSNTTWTIYNSTNTFLAYFHFGTDTASSSIDNISYTNISTYQENGNSFNIIDLSSTNCSTSDTGRYIFLIQNDTLKYTLIGDSCTDRSTALLNYHWIRFYSGIQNVNFLSTIKLFPNPFSSSTTIQTDKLVNDAILTVYNSFGQEVKQIQNISGQTITLHRGNLPSGIYFIRLTHDNKTIAVDKLILTDK